MLSLAPSLLNLHFFPSSLLSLLFVVSRKEFKNDRIHLSVIYRVKEVKVAQTSMPEL
jgi:hypothetical protein